MVVAVSSEVVVLVKSEDRVPDVVFFEPSFENDVLDDAARVELSVDDKTTLD